MEKDCKSTSRGEFERGKRRGYPLSVHWHHCETFHVPVRHHCLKLPQSGWRRFLRQHVTRG